MSENKVFDYIDDGNVHVIAPVAKARELLGASPGFVVPEHECLSSHARKIEFS